MAPPDDTAPPTSSLRELLAPDDTLAGFETSQVEPENAWLMQSFEVTVEAPREGLSPRGDESLCAKGWRWVGTKAERVTLMPGGACDVWIDPDETTYALVRRRKPILPLSPYYLMTYFDDGTCVETVALPTSPMRSEGNVVIVHGTNHLVADAAAHLDAVERRALLRGARVLPVRALRDVARLSAHYYRHVLSPRVAANTVNAWRSEMVVLCVAGATLVGLAKLVMAIVRARG